MTNKVSTAGWDRERWQQWRRTVQTIGGSDAAAVLGLSPYKSPYALWAEKTGAVEPEDISDKEAVRLGNDLEDYVSRRWAEKTGKRVRRERAVLSNPEYPFAHANIDRSVVGEPDAGLECKTTSSYSTIQKLRGGEIPDTWYCQCMHYMMVTGAKRWYLAAAAFGAGFFEFTITRDEEDVSALAEAERDFYDRILRREAPSPDGSPSSLEAMGKLMPQSSSMTIDASPIALQLMAYGTIKKQIAALEGQLREAEASIKTFMGSAEKCVCSGYSASWKTQERSTFDRAKYELDHGKIPDTYYKRATTRPFKVTLKED